jgi:hypothetical protein
MPVARVPKLESQSAAAEGTVEIEEVEISEVTDFPEA